MIRSPRSFAEHASRTLEMVSFFFPKGSIVWTAKDKKRKSGRGVVTSYRGGKFGQNCSVVIKMADKGKLSKLMQFEPRKLTFLRMFDASDTSWGVNQAQIAPVGFKYQSSRSINLNI